MAAFFVYYLSKATHYTRSPSQGTPTILRQAKEWQLKNYRFESLRFGLIPPYEQRCSIYTTSIYKIYLFVFNMLISISAVV